MERYTLEQRIKIVQIYYKNNENCAETVRLVRALYGNNTPSRTAIMKLIHKFERYGQVSDIKVPYRARRATSDANILAVAKSLAEQPTLSIPKRAKLLGISQTSLHRIITNELKLNKSKSVEEPKEDEEHGACVALVEEHGACGAVAKDNVKGLSVETIDKETVESEDVTEDIASEGQHDIPPMEDSEDDCSEDKSESSPPSYNSQNTLSPLEQVNPSSGT